MFRKPSCTETLSVFENSVEILIHDFWTKLYPETRLTIAVRIVWFRGAIKQQNSISPSFLSLNYCHFWFVKLATETKRGEKGTKSFLQCVYLVMQQLVVVCRCHDQLCEDQTEACEREGSRSGAGLPDFSWYKIPKREKIYQITTNYTKCS
jgi:hypothetical protein